VLADTLRTRLEREDPDFAETQRPAPAWQVGAS
jgi:hypothetical protein